MQRVPLTAEGANSLKVELERLKKDERPKVISAISEARKHGDLKENAEYHAAREQQSFIEGRIADLEAKVSNALIVDVTQIDNEGKVIFGATVKIINVDTNTEVTYKIVGEDEANIKDNKISVTSPIARALVGKFVDEEVIVQTPEGETAYEILDVQYI